MKPILFTGTIVLAILFTGCTGAHGNIDLHKTLALVLIILIIALFFILDVYSNLLRDDVDCNAIDAEVEAAKLNGRTRFRRNNAPFSLSRVQLAVWTVIISCSYIYLTFCNEACCPNPDINQTALILMGIGAAVTASGTIIDKGDIQNNKQRHQNHISQGFFTDILSDANGISIPRFQNVVWTGIAMVVYLTKVFMVKHGCSTSACPGLPELDSTLLALTGISNATYLAMKTQENTTPPATPTIPPANNPAPVAPTTPATPVTPPVVPAAPVIPPVVPAAPLPDPAAAVPNVTIPPVNPPDTPATN
ncbi:hypothetical protein BEL04_07215 [Mucilaginibacter sp. PPCGB 2223]|nr:hypothetical protein BEL04_07215 [Mucilaginibacter sp. PPCGB 2223]